MEKRSEQLELQLKWHMFGEHLDKPTSIKVDPVEPAESYDYIFEPTDGSRYFETAYLLTTYLPTEGFAQLIETTERHDSLIPGLVEKVERDSLSTIPLRLVKCQLITWKDGHQQTKMVFGTKSEFEAYEADPYRE